MYLHNVLPLIYVSTLCIVRVRSSCWKNGEKSFADVIEKFEKTEKKFNFVMYSKRDAISFCIQPASQTSSVVECALLAHVL